MAKILIGITGGIAAYKAASVVSYLANNGHEVKVIMTEAAKQFVSMLTFSALSHNEVYGDHNRFANDGHIHHIELADWADLFVIVPATYNTIMKIHLGLADNLLMSTLIPYKGMALNQKGKKPILLCPAMNTNMWNVLLKEGVLPALPLPNFSIVEPDEGVLACGAKGMGKLAKTKEIIQNINHICKYSTGREQWT